MEANYDSLNIAMNFTVIKTASVSSWGAKKFIRATIQTNKHISQWLDLMQDTPNIVSVQKLLHKFKQNYRKSDEKR